MNGGDQFTLKDMLRHQSLSTTAIYVHLANDFNDLKVLIIMKNSCTVQDIFQKLGYDHISL